MYMLYRAMDGAMICWGIVELNISAFTTKIQLTQSVIPTVNGSRDKFYTSHHGLEVSAKATQHITHSHPVKTDYFGRY
jgi:hypothetical protein